PATTAEAELAVTLILTSTVSISPAAAGKPDRAGEQVFAISSVNFSADAAALVSRKKPKPAAHSNTSWKLISGTQCAAALKNYRSPDWMLAKPATAREQLAHRKPVPHVMAAAAFNRPLEKCVSMFRAAGVVEQGNFAQRVKPALAKVESAAPKQLTCAFRPESLLAEEFAWQEKAMPEHWVHPQATCIC